MNLVFAIGPYMNYGDILKEYWERVS